MSQDSVELVQRPRGTASRVMSGKLGVVEMPGGSAYDKASGLVAAFDGLWSGTVLDVGCRTMELSKALAGHEVSYLGLDVRPPADIVADLDAAIPLDDQSVDLVVALDVLEHTNDLHHAFAELCRVARSHVLISLPNCYEIRLRTAIARGRPLGDKYGLPVEPPADRHRWFFSLDDARRFCSQRAAAEGWQVADERVVVGPLRGRIRPLVQRWPNLLSPTLVTLLSRPT
jgi:2-polyprenyl-3-methyl-5-hydroxy-6-metoxy-1,4-benzoquinol methylase